MNPRDIDWERLDRYVSGEGTPEEREALRQWVDADPELRTVAYVMRTAERLPGTRPSRWDTQHSLDIVTERLGLSVDGAVDGVADSAGEVRLVKTNDGGRHTVLRLTHVERGRRRWRIGVGVAAAVIAVVLGADRWLGGAITARWPRVAVQSAAGSEYTTLRGQRLVLHLPDRTQVTLAPESRLRLDPHYGHDRRIVELQGEADFVVAHDATRPFAVRAGHLVAHDIGTRFDIRAYPGDSTPRVVVAEGRVMLGLAGAMAAAHADSLVLGAGDLGRLTDDGRLTLTRGVSVDQYFAWTTGKLRLRRVPLRDAVVELGRWYDVDVRLADTSLANEEVTASFQNEPAPEAIGLVAAAAGLRVERHGTEFVLRREHH